MLPCIENQLPTLMSRQDIGLVIIDSLAAPFRSDEGPEAARLSIFRKIRMKLHDLNSIKNVAVIVLNQVRKKYFYVTMKEKVMLDKY